MSDVTAHWLLERLDGVHVTGDGWMARCPAHDDHTPSLSFRVTQSAVVLLHCFAGCQLPDICEALGIEVRDLFPSREWSEPALGRPQDNGARSEAEGKTGLDDSRVDLVKLILEGIPERECVPGCDGWLLRAKRYLVFADAGVGKSLGWLVVGVGIVRAGGTVAIIDVENGADEYARRLDSIIGEDAELAAACSRLRYYEYPTLSLKWSEGEWVDVLADCDVIIFDSSRPVLSTVGLGEDSNDDYAQFMGAMVMPLSKSGKTTVILDNCGHNGGQPRGASSKRQLNEVLYSLSAPDGDLDVDIERRLVWRRTRGRFAGAVPKTLEQRIGGGTYTMPVPTDDEAKPFRPTQLMERVSIYVEVNDGCSQNAIVNNVSGRKKYVIEAIDKLVGEGFIQRDEGSSNKHHSVTPYRRADDDED